MKAWLNHSVDGDTISITDPTSTTGETSNTVSKSVTAGEQITFNFELDISDVGAESDGSNPDLMWLNMEAESRPGNINGLAFNAAFLSWRQGGHV